MAQKCVVCKTKVETTFLGKIKGSYVKKKVVCSNCQKEHGQAIVEKV